MYASKYRVDSNTIAAYGCTDRDSCNESTRLTKTRLEPIAFDAMCRIHLYAP